MGFAAAVFSDLAIRDVAVLHRGRVCIVSMQCPLMVLM